MKHLLLTTSFLLVLAASSAQVVFYESFDGIAGSTAGGAGTYTFPTGWRLRNVDARTPDAQVSYVNQAWIRREDFGLSVIDSCAFSNSYYSPVGAADDWMWTPLIGPLPANSVLSWRARSYDPLYPENYEVRIMTAAAGPPTGGTAVMGNQVTSSTLLYSNAAESSSWTTRSVNLSAYTGQSVYIAFRNISNDKYILVIDDVKVQVVYNYDAKVSSVSGYEYTQTPKSQAIIPMGGTITNNGQQTLTNVSLNASVYNPANAFVQGTIAIATPSLASGASASYNLGNYTPPAGTTGTYTIKYFPGMSQSDQVTSNDTILKTVTLNDSVFARDNGTPTSNIGIGIGDGYLGTSFTIASAVEARSVVASFNRGYTGKKYACVIWNTTGAGVPNAIIASTDTLLYPNDNALLVTLPIYGGYVSLSPGKYVVTAVEFDSTLAVSLTDNVYTAGVNWVKWSAHPAWANMETFGSQYQKAVYLRLNVNVNNSTPVITSNGGGAAAGVSIAENIAAVTTVTATDADPAPNISYKLNGGADAAKFTINSVTGALSFITSPDYENPADADVNNTYIVIVRATDGHYSDDQTITVTVTNTNDIAPVVTSNGGGTTAGVSINENSAGVTTVTATDADAGPTTITYSINGGADAAKFTINASTGVLAFITAPDFEVPGDADANNTYIVVVRASDGVNAGNQTITVTVGNLNDNAPVITSNGGGTTANVSANENGTGATIVTATDPDGTLNTLTYSINGGVDAAKFSINSSTGVLAFITAPDYEVPADADANNTYIVVVRASDGVNTDDQTITVTVINLNDNIPVITSNGGGAAAGIGLAENSTNATTVTTADADGNLNPFVYSITGGADAARFTINSATGVLSFIAAPDYENPSDADVNNTYIVTVRVSDGTYSDDQAIAVTITNVNDNTPVITSNGGGTTAGVSIPENNAAVTTVMSTDADGSLNAITYSISGGADAAKFSISSTTGIVSFISAPDFENPGDADANNTYIVTVRASDGTNTDDQAITVTVTNVNDNTPVITSNGGGLVASVNTAENTTAATTVVATDADAGTSITYSLNGGSDASKFSINSSTGALNFITAPDYENPADADANNVYVVVVRASDGVNTDEQVMTVTVTNINDNTPVITSNGGGTTASISVLNPQQVVTTVTATDGDGTLNPLVYSITGGVDAARFSINAATGLLSFTSPTNVSSPQDADGNNTYLVTVQVSDGTLTDNQAITVTVTGLLPVTLVKFNAHSSGANNIIEWTTANETGMDSYEVEKSANGHNFEKAGAVMAKGSISNQYSFTDIQPYQPTSFYRLKMKGKDGVIQYSGIVKLERAAGIAAMNVYPNPVKNHVMMLQWNNLPRNHYTLELYNTSGQLVMRQLTEHPGGSAAGTVNLPASVAAGMYVLVIKAGTIEMTQRIVVE